MADVKAAHYWKQVQAALTAGHWNSLTAGRTPSGSFLPWSELFRKAKKHAKQPDSPEAASQTYFLSLLLSTTSTTVDDANTKRRLDVDGFGLGDECVLLEERREDALKAYESLQQLNSSDEYVKQTLAFFAYALSRPSECLDYVSSVAFADRLTPTKPAVLITSTDEKTEKASQLSAHSASVELGDDNAWTFLEAVRSACLEGMAHERLSPGSPSQALASYDKGLRLLRAFSVPKSPPPRTGRESFESFNKYAELWRWTERILWRTVSLAARHKDVEATLPVFRTYTIHSVHWPPNFESEHRSIICSLYLRALTLSAGSKPNENRIAWTNEIRGVVNEYRAILAVSTRFPSAGEHNVLVEDFVDYCVAAWEAGGSVPEQASWVIDVLWWATRLTFNSPRVLRHMFRLLHVSGDDELAKRVLRLYVQLVRKARETGTMNEQGIDTHDISTTEPDALWVRTLVQGARMLCRTPGGVKEVREAAELVAYARDRVANLDDELMASVDLADGICKSILAIREQEPTTRGPLLSISVELFMRAVERHPTPPACFHAAIALSRPIPERDIQKAIELCRQAVEAEPREVRYWHLLALLAAKQGEWKKAEGVLQAALEIVEDMELQSDSEELIRDGIVHRDFGTTNGDRTPTASTPHAEGNGMNGGPALRQCPSPNSLLDPDAESLPSASSLLRPIPDHPQPTRRQLFEYVLQLRMTQIAIMELVEGPESVEACWLEVFEWYSQRHEAISQGGSVRASTDARHTPTPAYAESSARASIQIQNSVSEVSSLGISNDQSVNSSSAETVTIRSRVRSSVDRSAETPQARRKSKERSSTESQQSERDKKGKRVQRILKNQVHKQQARMQTISRKIGHGVSKSSMSLHRSNSAPDFHAMLARAGPYQASSIHSRRRISFSSRLPRSERGRDTASPPPSPPPPPLPTATQESSQGVKHVRKRRLLSDLWLMSAATFRRLEKIDQTRGAIQEAETLDEENEAVWVQLGLYFSAQGEEGKAIEAFQKALFIAPDDVSATIHLCNLYLTSRSPLIRGESYGAVDIATGMLEALTRGTGWDVAEAWYLLAKAYNMQDRKDRERECLMFALGLAEVRGVRDIGSAVGWCL